MLWDRGEANGYAWHMTGDPLPNTPKHRVLMHGVRRPPGGARGRRGRGPHNRRAHPRPGRPAGPQPDKVPYWGIPTFGSSYDGSAMVVWDSGSPPRR